MDWHVIDKLGAKGFVTTQHWEVDLLFTITTFGQRNVTVGYYFIFYM